MTSRERGKYLRHVFLETRLCCLYYPQCLVCTQKIDPNLIYKGSITAHSITIQNKLSSFQIIVLPNLTTLGGDSLRPFKIHIETLYIVYLDILKNMSLQNFVTSFHYNFYFYIILRTIESIKKDLNFNIDLYLICFTLKVHKDFY